ncbi:TetR/AcrR family transcriptional regulator [Actinoplanes sp. NPDC051411]|uniref:TetR/AcrR family transcriptional regulator n=1 Tax=Actinoplanes sp. NPDC051411 TaxID=3155522 RepID=UPI00341C4713
MTTPGLRERKKQELRDRISGVATQLILTRGFEAVSVSEIAAAAGVSRMTVFNYFARKEDMFLDRLPELTGLIEAGVRGSATPLAALRDVFLQLLDTRHPLAGFADRMTYFWQVVIDSPALRARVREFLEELEGLVAGLFEEGGQAQPRLTAALALAAYRVCYVDAAARIMAGEQAESFFDEHRARVTRAFDQAAIGAAAVEENEGSGR